MNISDSWNGFLKNFRRKFQKDLIEIAQSNLSGKPQKTISAQQYLMYEEPKIIQNEMKFVDEDKTDELVSKANLGQILGSVAKSGKPTKGETPPEEQN